MHRLRIEKMELVGGRREIDFHAGLNAVRGPITTGKTTFVRLLRAILGSVPDDLPPETERIQSIRAIVSFDSGRFAILRPLTSNPLAPVEIAELPQRGATSSPDRELANWRLPAMRATGNQERSYGDWLLEQLGLPRVSVPARRFAASSDLTPVTINDWLGYCIIPGDEIDSSVFGHTNNFRDIKRRYVFELAYGLYDAETARLNQNLRAVELRLEAVEKEALIAADFFASTAFASREALQDRITLVENELQRLNSTAEEFAAKAHDASASGELRDSLYGAQRAAAETRNMIARIDDQMRDLQDLEAQLVAQSGRLTRAIVAEEWLVDFDFVVCPRCGNGLNQSRAEVSSCYLCLQPLKDRTGLADSLLAEQERVANQIKETEEVIALRLEAAASLRQSQRDQQAEVGRLSAELDRQTLQFISAQADALSSLAVARARQEAELAKLREYLTLLQRQASVEAMRTRLAEERADLLEALDRKANAKNQGSQNVSALENKFFEYLQQLNVPIVGERLTAIINRRTYLPEVSGRSFEALSSQGLEVLVNAAHALAHHVVAIDRNLPLPGLLVLDGLSSNVGREGFDQERVNDLYRLVLDIASNYNSDLQLISVDNDVPSFIEPSLCLTLSQEDRLIRTAS